MSEALSIDQQVKRHFPNAVTELAFMQTFREKLVGEYKFDISKVLLASSICADDVIVLRESETPANKIQGKLKRELLGPFSMGGLAGMPYSGRTGIMTIAHHVPDGGSVVITYGPHIGISDEGVLGKILRPGQHQESGACGALSLALTHFRSSPNYVPEPNDDDMEQMTLERRLWPYRSEILAADQPLLAATEKAFEIINDLIHRYVRELKEQFSCEFIALAGGIVINTSPHHEDYIDVRHSSIQRVQDL